MKDTKKKHKMEKIEFRVTKDQKKKLMKQAKKMNLNLSEYVRIRIFESKDKNQFTAVHGIYVMTLATDLVRYIEEYCNVENDQYLKERVENLWEVLQ